MSGSVSVRDHLDLSETVQKYEFYVNTLGTSLNSPFEIVEAVYNAGTELMVDTFNDAERLQFNMIVDSNTKTCLVCTSVLFMFTQIAGIIAAVDPKHLEPEEVREVLTLRFKGIEQALIIWSAHMQLLEEEAR